MAAIRFSRLKSLGYYICPFSKFHSSRQSDYCLKFVEYGKQIDVRPSVAYTKRKYHTGESGSAPNHLKNGFGIMGMESLLVNQYYRNTFPNSCHRGNASVIAMNSVLNYRSYSLFSVGKGEKGGETEVSAVSGSAEPVSSGSVSGGGGSDLVDMVKQGWQNALDAMAYSGEWASEASDDLNPYVKQLLDAHPYLRDVIVPVGCTLTGTILAWFVMPRILRRFHRYSTQGPAALLSRSPLWGPVPYEKSFWGALEDPIRYLITFMAFSQIGMMVAPMTISSQYIIPAWRGAVILSFVWFLYRWKSNVFARALDAGSIAGIEREKLLALDKISSVGLFVLGLMALAEACGVAVQSILTVGGIGGVATAFAARDILGNVLSGLSVQITQPFSVGDTIKAGSVEGQVVEMGLVTTSLLSAEKFPIIVPNSMFSSQVIINKSRAQWRAMVTKIPLRSDDLGKIPQISEDIKSMLRSNSKVFLEKEPPYCFLSRIERSYAEVTLGCNLKHMSKDELYSTEQDILLQSVQIIKQHGATLSSMFSETNS
ncbi:hypothetical protein NMG60_11029013 [Bertholletia excelsa]